ncbi:hypothetical protein CORC01_13458 [Colletotrichum orchidophilum]|uniref:Uncharacterized protein n=1 Tax=Colletotrichum orchidophilum TaxID=1209926 RepID=A0A1G4AQ04_9PEZI|nr:uncharacterized protein CORC01_13458 [Colletotrichum orchidophilum]OHE91258.1 hypothetical protein CORC01_13458 [Colletotrichum orchidophilum]
MASTTQSLEGGVEIAKSPEWLALKSWVLSMIADYIWRPFDAIAVELVRTDYEIACVFETDLHEPARYEALTVPNDLARVLRQPLAGILITIREYRRKARDLRRDGQDSGRRAVPHGFRHIGISVGGQQNKDPINRIVAVREAAGTRHSSSSSKTHPVAIVASEKERILETVRIAAPIYSRSIKSLRQISRFYDAEVSQDTYPALLHVSMTKWKRIRGMLFWVMLVATPNAAADAKGQLARRKMAVMGLPTGFEVFALGCRASRPFGACSGGSPGREATPGCRGLRVARSEVWVADLRPGTAYGISV